MSAKDMYEYDCKEDQSRLLASSSFSGNMGTGTVVYSASNLETKWEPVEPESIGELHLKIFCGKDEWTWVDMENNLFVGALTTYVDYATIHKANNKVKIWALLDILKTSSSKIQYEYDCKEAQRRVLIFMNFSGNMGTGWITSSNNNPQEWMRVTPGGSDKSLWKIACRK